MSNLTTEYMGLKLKNPVLAASCGLTGTIDSIRRIAEAGAGGIVLKSLFEEQIVRETRDVEQYITPAWHTEAYDYIHNMGMELGPERYLKLVEQARQEVDVPVIASLNCVTSRYWLDYAKKLELAGADGLELNIGYLPTDMAHSSLEVEQLHINVIKEVRQHISMPLAVKIGPYFSSLARFAWELHSAGAAALVLFNRFYQVDIDTDTLTYTSGSRFSTPGEADLPMRWIALLSDQLACDFAATTGVHDGDGVIKMLLAGAAAVQVCSALYINDIEHIGEIVRYVEQWMHKKGFASIAEFRGKLARTDTDTMEMLERIQYIKALTGVE